MRVICLQEDLGPVLHMLSKVTRNEVFPLYQSVLFTATRSDTTSDQGTLTLMGMGMYRMVGMITSLPATVDLEGQALVPIEPLAEYVGGLRPGLLTLSQKREEGSIAQEHSPQSQGAVAEGQMHSFVSTGPDTQKIVFPLQIDSTFTSDAGTTSTNQAKLAIREECDSYPRPPIQQWLTTSVSMSGLQTASFKEAIARCVPLVNKGRQWKGETIEMYGMLLHSDAGSLKFIAASATMLASHRLPLEYPASFSFAGLFSGQALSWIKEALSNDEITLALASDEQTNKPVLLIVTERMTWFCRSMDAPLPHTWTSILHHPHEAELQIRRKDLTRPLKFFAGSLVQTYQVLSLLTKGTTLWMSSLAANDEIVQERQDIPLVCSSADLSILINPKQFKQLVRSVRGEVLRFQVGHFERRDDHVCKRIGFLRIVSDQTTVMMSLSRSEPAPVSIPSQKAGLTEGNAEQVLALQEV